MTRLPIENFSPPAEKFTKDLKGASPDRAEELSVVFHHEGH